MKVIAGLGNPGRKYEGTRHNVGYEVVAELARRHGASRPKVKFESEILETTAAGHKLLLVLPQTFMNLSGRALRPLVDFYQVPLDDCLVVCDDMNLKTGQLRLRGGGSAGGQKGLHDIIRHLGTENVPRLRIGIGRPEPGVDAAAYVLSRFRKEELPALDRAVRAAADGVELWLCEGLERAMSSVNASRGADDA